MSAQDVSDPGDPAEGSGGSPAPEPADAAGEPADAPSGSADALDVVEAASHVPEPPKSEANGVAPAVVVEAPQAELVAPPKEPAKNVPLWRKALEIIVPLLIAAAVGLGGFMLRPSRGYRFHASSTYSGYKQDGWTGLLRSGDILFCTNNQMDPWVEIDLAKKRTVHRVAVVNRPDYKDRVLPLVVEVLEPDGSYREVGRKSDTFDEWTFDFPPVETTKLRLRVDGRATWLHLSRVNID